MVKEKKFCLPKVWVAQGDTQCTVLKRRTVQASKYVIKPQLDVEEKLAAAAKAGVANNTGRSVAAKQANSGQKAAGTKGSVQALVQVFLFSLLLRAVVGAVPAIVLVMHFVPVCGAAPPASLFRSV